MAFLLTNTALLPLCGLGLPLKCPKSLTDSRVRLPVRYPGLNGGLLHAILPPQLRHIKLPSQFVDGLKRRYRAKNTSEHLPLVHS